MDALEFLKERKRMCKSYEKCEGCPLKRGGCSLSSSLPDKDCERIITTVEQWSKEHPRKTRQSVFLEQYPDAKIDQDKVLAVCPLMISATHRNVRGNCKNSHCTCADCRREFWMQGVEQ